MTCRVASGCYVCAAVTAVQFILLTVVVMRQQQQQLGGLDEEVSSQLTLQPQHKLSSRKHERLSLKVPRPTSMSFGTSENFSARSTALRTEAFCDCYDGSCTLYLKHAAIKRVANGVFVIRPFAGSDRDSLVNVTRRCRNKFPYCDYRDTSVYCSGITYEISDNWLHGNSKMIPSAPAGRGGFDEDHLFVHARALGGQFYHGLVYPRGLMLNWAMMQLAAERICGVNSSYVNRSRAEQCVASLETTVLLFSDVHYASESMKAAGITKFASLIELEELLGFPEALYFHINGNERSARWITIGNRILSYDGRIRDKIVRGVGIIREEVYRPPKTAKQARVIAVDPRVLQLPPPPRPAGSDAILVTLRKREVMGTGAWVLGSRNRGVDGQFKRSLERNLPRVTGRPLIVYSDADVRRFGQLRFRDQLAVMMNYSFFIADEGAHLTWMLLTNPRSTWITIYDFHPGMWTPNLRYHIRTWLVRRDCRFIAYVIADERQAGEDVLFDEVSRPYESVISVVSPDGVTRCNSVESCANALDFSLVVDMRGMYPIGV